MGEPLGEYRRKRDSRRTPEPIPEQVTSGADDTFVIQEHHARRLHWDVRLERDGVLVSWAVPKGLPVEPGGLRLAVRTEDHPLEYADFEGEIPKGEYGAGRMFIWDRGRYDTLKWSDDEVQVILRGERVRGRYTFFRTRRDTDDRQWLVRRSEPATDRDPFPEALSPMLAVPGPLPADGDDWAFEFKWDGVRAIVSTLGGTWRIHARSGGEMTAGYPELAALADRLGPTEAVLDGEIVAIINGRPDFGALQERMHVTDPGQARLLARTKPVTLLLFDVLYLDGRRLLELSYDRRRELLEELDLNGARWRTPPCHHGDGPRILRISRRQGLEGVVAKRRDSPYLPGRRSPCWIKTANVNIQEVLIGGWRPGAGRRSDTFGSLLVGIPEGDRLRYVGSVGTGFTEADLRELRARLTDAEQPDRPFGDDVPREIARVARWVAPTLVGEVVFREWTQEGRMRAPSWRGLRPDKTPESMTTDPPVVAGAHASTDPSAPTDTSRARTGSEGADSRVREAVGQVSVTVGGRRLRLSNLDKVLYPAVGFTKAQVLDYYVRIAPVLLPHLANRPTTFIRFPDGVNAWSFFEKNVSRHAPSWVRTERLPTPGSVKGTDTADFAVLDDLPSLVWAANLAALELHVPQWTIAGSEAGRRVRARACPDLLVFDLDPGEPSGLVECARVAVRIRALLAEDGLTAYAKTSGSKGMQLYCPVSTEAPGQTLVYARAVAERLARQIPREVVAVMTRALRSGRVLIDWNQNNPAKTTIAPYSLRARERPTVSTPVSWAEVESCRDPRDLVFPPEAVLSRVDEHGDLFAALIGGERPAPPSGVSGVSRP